MVTMLTVRVSGAHYNPAVTFVVMFKRENEEKFPKVLGIIYIAAQFIGAFLGALLSWFLNLNGGRLLITSGYVFQAILIELLGSFLVFLVYIILNEEDEEAIKSQVKKDSSLLALFWTLAFGSMLALTAPLTTGSLNPAIGFAIEMTMLMSTGNTEFLGDTFIYLLCPIGGAVLSLIFYYLVYLKTKVE